MGDIALAAAKQFPFFVCGQIKVRQKLLFQQEFQQAWLVTTLTSVLHD